METWLDSAAFQRAMVACRANDKTTFHRIIEEQLTAAEGPERAFWLRVRANQRARDALLPHLLELSWADLEEARRAAPEDQEVLLHTLSAAFGLALKGERIDRLMAVLKAIRAEHGNMDGIPFFWQDIGTLNMKRGRWRKAARAFGRAIKGFSTYSKYEQAQFACRLAHYHAWRAICQVAAGEVDQAAEDVKTALRLAGDQPPGNINHQVMGMARAELALRRGQLQEARSAVQQGIMQDSMVKRPRVAPAQMAETELLAARIARAEGNPVGFDHFCERALAICKQYNLPLTEARILAVKAGAER